MSITTSLAGRLRNTNLPKSHGLWPLFEAVTNSIHAIEEAGLEAHNGLIEVEIIRSLQANMDLDDTRKKRGPEAENDIVGFKIADNGIGFNDQNLEHFKTLDSEHKIAIGGRGVGRLLWLKAFDAVKISSRFFQSDKMNYREIIFDIKNGVTDEVSDRGDSNLGIGSVVHLDGFKRNYRDSSRKTAQAIANSLFEHCLWYFVRPGSCPKIKVIENDEAINLDDIYREHMHDNAKIETKLCL